MSSRRLRHSLLYLLMLSFVLCVHWISTSSQVGEQISRTVWGLNFHYYSRLMAEMSALSQRSVEREAFDILEPLMTEIPQASHASGLYTGSLRVTVHSALPDTIVRFTLDGSVPSSRSPVFGESLLIDKTTILRARAYQRDKLPSRTLTASFILRAAPGVPVVSLVLDPVFLYDKHSGIYAHPKSKGREWERPVEFAIMNGAGELLESEARLRIHGNASRIAVLKSLRIYLTREQAALKNWFGLESDRIADSQSEWVLKWSSSRQVYSDRVASRLAKQMGLAVGPRLVCLLYVNGKFWSAYDLSERINPAFASGKASGTSFSHLHGGALMYPVPKRYDIGGWKKLYDFIVEKDLQRDGNFAAVEDQIDIGSLIDYFVLSIFLADGDRPQGNIDMFKGSEVGSRWFFGIWDFDGGVNYMGSYIDHDTLAWHLRPGVRRQLKLYGVEDDDQIASSTHLLRALMTNDGFRVRFVSRFDELLSTVFDDKNLVSIFEGVLKDYAAVVPIEREPFDANEVWGGPITYEARIQEIRDFLTQRTAVVRDQLEARFGH